MHDIEMHEPSAEFVKCWNAAGAHINRQVPDEEGVIWMRSHLMPPFLEHLSFALGNQLFFIRLEDVTGHMTVPGSRLGLLSIAKGCNGHPCLMPMKKLLATGEWVPAESGWGLIDARTFQPLDPFRLVTNEPIELTDWELQDFAVQVVRTQLEADGYELMSWQGNPAVNPSLWFVGDSDGPEWVVVRAVRYPHQRAVRPMKWDSIAAGCAKLSTIGHFASVMFASPEQPLATDDEQPLPIWRGRGAEVRYDGLEPPTRRGTK